MVEITNEQRNKRAINKYVNYVAAKTTSQKTINHTKAILEKVFSHDCIKNIYYKQLTLDDVIKYIAAMGNELRKKSAESSWEVKRQTTSVPYRINVLSILARFYKFNGNETMYTQLKEMRPIRGERGKREIVQLTENEKRKLIQANTSSNTFINYRNRMICVTLYGTGIRVSELVLMKVKDLEFDKSFTGKSKIVQIIGKGDKERPIAIPRWLWNELKTFANQFKFNENQYFFVGDRDWSKQLSTMTIWKIVKTKAIQAGVYAHDRAIFPHCLRSTFCTDLDVLGWDLLYRQSIMGHASPNTTKMYTKINENKIKNLPVVKEVKSGE